MYKSVMVITEQQLKACMAQGKEANLMANLQPLNNAIGVFQINTPMRVAHFIAQLAHESSCLNFSEENLNYSAALLVKVFPHFFPTIEVATPYNMKPQMIANLIYANRMGNGDAASNDGWNYRGRGAIQNTGKLNYELLSKALNVDFVKQPDLLKQPLYSMMAAGEFWKAHGLNELADVDDLTNITKRINGGLNGYDSRRQFLDIAKHVFGVH